MSSIFNQRSFAAVFLLLILASPLSAQTSAQKAPTAVDATLFTTYDMASNFQSVSWVVCGSTSQTEGCYASGSLGPFGKIGALMEGSPSTSGSTVSRSIYVVDSASGTSGTGVTLNVYKKTDTVSASSDTVSVTLSKSITLPLTGGSTALCSMAANSMFLYIGTDQSTEAAVVQKFTLKVTGAGAFSSGVTSITADSYGYVTITQGNGFAVYGPTGAFEEDGGGAEFMLDTMNGVLPSTLAASEVHNTRQVGYGPKKNAGSQQ
jgi:hypothetical protein